jgi:lysophospholipase L1-like esterase
MAVNGAVEETMAEKSWVGKIGRILLHSLWIIVMSIVATEIILLTFDPLDLDFYDAVGEYYRSRILHTDYGFYINRPGDSYDMREGASVTINREGFRGDDFSFDKPKGTVRILCVGDSMTFGWGAPQNSIFPVILEKIALEEGFPCEVVTAAACSWNTRTEFNFFQKRGKLYNPDILLLLVVGNDLLTPENSTPRREDFFRHMMAGRMGLRHSYLLRAYFHFQSKFLAGPEFIEAYERDPTVFDENLQALGEMISLCESLDIRPLVFLGVTGDGSSAFDQMYQSLYGNVLNEHGISTNVCQVYFSDRDLKVSPADTHASALGHQLVAQTMYPKLRPLLQEAMEQSNVP